MIDRMLKSEIIGTVRKAMTDVLEESQEAWLSGDELCKQFQMFSPSWLKRYGSRLPRTRAVVTDNDGMKHVTGWVYPRNKIQRMVREGKIASL